MVKDVTKVITEDWEKDLNYIITLIKSYIYSDGAKFIGILVVLFLIISYFFHTQEQFDHLRSNFMGDKYADWKQRKKELKKTNVDTSFSIPFWYYYLPNSSMLMPLYIIYYFIKNILYSLNVFLNDPLSNLLGKQSLESVESRRKRMKDIDNKFEKKNTDDKTLRSIWYGSQSKPHQVFEKKCGDIIDTYEEYVNGLNKIIYGLIILLSLIYVYYVYSALYTYILIPYLKNSIDCNLKNIYKYIFNIPGGFVLDKNLNSKDILKFAFLGKGSKITSYFIYLLVATLYFMYIFLNIFLTKKFMKNDCYILYNIEKKFANTSLTSSSISPNQLNLDTKDKIKGLHTKGFDNKSIISLTSSSGKDSNNNINISSYIKKLDSDETSKEIKTSYILFHGILFKNFFVLLITLFVFGFYSNIFDEIVNFFNSKKQTLSSFKIPEIPCPK